MELFTDFYSNVSIIINRRLVIIPILYIYEKELCHTIRVIPPKQWVVDDLGTFLLRPSPQMHNLFIQPDVSLCLPQFMARTE
jgi:hypothetical protein